MDTSFDEKICEVLKKRDVISEEDLQQVLGVYKERGGKLFDILLQLNKATKEDILSAQSEVLDIPPLNLGKINVEREAMQLVPKRVAMMYQVLPISRMGNSMTLAVVDASNIFAIDDIRAITKMDINLIIADRDDMKDSLIRCYERSADEEMSEIVGDISGDQMEMVSEEEDEITSGDMLKIIDDTPIIKLSNLILSQGVKEGASDILIEALDKNFVVRYRIDGVLHEKQKPPKKYHAPLISRLKVVCGLNIAERRLPQDGRFQLRVEERRVDFRVSILPSIMGEKACLRILDKNQVMVDINRLGVGESDKKKIIAASDKPHGLILACGPTGSGKTTTLYSILKYVDSPGKNIVTVEDPVEYEVSGINQVNIKSDIGLTFAGSLRSILRQDPDVILVGEIRDFETVDIAIKAALTGHLVLSTLHTNSASGSVVRLINMGVEPFLICSAIELFIAQRLVRKLCLDCREQYTPVDEIADKFGLYTADGKAAAIYKPKGCQNCMNTGYKGRMAIVECLDMTPGIKELIFEKAHESLIEKEARRGGMRTLRQNGISAVLDGVTSLEEVLRLTVDERAAG